MSLFGWKSSRPLARTPGDVGPRKRRPVLAECLRQVADNNFCRGTAARAVARHCGRHDLRWHDRILNLDDWMTRIRPARRGRR